MLEKSGEPLFKAYSASEGNGKWKYNAWLWPTSFAYSTGYKEAADLIVVNILEFEGTIDTYVYPALFSYRQYLELQMKEILAKCETQSSVVTHDLNKLCPGLRASFEDLWGPDEDNFNQIGKWIGEFNEIDPNPGTNFRYPTSKSGDLSVEPGRMINLLHIKEIVETMSNYLRGASFGLGIENEEAAENAMLQADMEGYAS